MNRRATLAAAACAGLGSGLGIGLGVRVRDRDRDRVRDRDTVRVRDRDRVSGLRPPKRSMPPSIAAAVCAQRAAGVGCVGPRPVDPACAIGPPAVPGAGGR